MLDLRKVAWTGPYISDPSCISCNGERPKSIFNKSLYVLATRRNAWHETTDWNWPRNCISASLSGLSSAAEPYRTQGMSFLAIKKPIVIVTYDNSDVAIGFMSFRKFSRYGYERLLEEISIQEITKFWHSFPQVEKDWLRCFLCKTTSISKFPAFRKEAFSSYFVGLDFPMQWTVLEHFDHACEAEFLRFSSQLAERVKK